MWRSLLISSGIFLCCSQIKAELAYFTVNYAKGTIIRCSIIESEKTLASVSHNYAMVEKASTWTALDINYNSEPPIREISRCIDEITKSQLTQYYLQDFVSVVHLKHYKGVARQWVIRVNGKIVCFLGVPDYL